LALSQAEFNRLVADYGAVLYRTAFRLVGDRHDAEDLVQETFRSCWQSRERFQAELGERAWLVSILRRRVVDRWRRRRLPTVVGTDAADEPATAAVDPLAADYSDEVQRALMRLPAELKETLLLVVVSELTHQEAADVLEVPLGTVLSRVSRARQRLREYLLQERRKELVEDAASPPQEMGLREDWSSPRRQFPRRE
jgi:RNA polymerase sigma-70 factor (ECF subfamily)